MKRIFTLFLFLAFAVFALTLNLKNPETVTLKYYGGFEREFDLFIVLLIPFALGLLIGVLLMSVSVMRNKMEKGRAKKDLAKVEKEVQSLRAAPVQKTAQDLVSKEP